MRALALAAGLVALVALSACGRAGDPELPPSASAGAAAPGEPQPVEDRPFVLDALIR